MIRPKELSVIVPLLALLILPGLLVSPSSASQPQRSSPPASARIELYLTAQQTETYVTNLTVQDLVITEDDKPQEIVSLHSPGEAPISLLLIVDRGKDSTSEDLDRSQAALQSLAENLKTKSEIAMAAYSSELRFIRPFSADRKTISVQISQLPSFSGKSSTGDSIDYAVRSIRADARHSRRVLVVLSSEFNKFGPGTLDHVLSERLQLHFVNVGSEKLSRGFIFSESTAKNLNASAGKTGGRFWQANSETNARLAGEQLARFLDAQFEISYEPANPSRKGKTRSITVHTPGRTLELTYMRQYFEPRF